MKSQQIISLLNSPQSTSSCNKGQPLQDFIPPEPQNQKKKEIPILKIDISYSDLIEDESKSVSVSAHQQMREVFCFDSYSPSYIQSKTYDDYHRFNTIYDISMRQCGREYQQDRYSTVYPLKKGLRDAFFGVYDGHSTQVVAQILRHQLHTYIASTEKYEEDIESCIKQAFKKLDDQITVCLKNGNLKGGSTALCGIFKDQQLYISNVGDSQAMIVYENFETQFLNRQHRPGEESEKQRLQLQQAILLERNSSLYVNGQLGVSRSFGDHQYKDFISAEPQISQILIQPCCQYLLMGTDGFWDREISFLMQEWFSQHDNNMKGLSLYLTGLASERSTSFQKDNMTLLIVDITRLAEKNIQNELGQNSSGSNSDGETNNENELEPVYNNNKNIPLTQKRKTSQFNFDSEENEIEDEIIQPQQGEAKFNFSENLAEISVEKEQKLSCGKMKNQQSLDSSSELKNAASCPKKFKNQFVFGFQVD